MNACKVTADCNIVVFYFAHHYLIIKMPYTGNSFQIKEKAMAKKTFESALSRLEEITRELEDGEISLENSLKKFDEGIKLAEYCNQKLSEAKAKVEVLLQKDGELTTEPFEGNEREDKELP